MRPRRASAAPTGPPRDGGGPPPSASAVRGTGAAIRPDVPGTGSRGPTRSATRPGLIAASAAPSATSRGPAPRPRGASPPIRPRPPGTAPPSTRSRPRRCPPPGPRPTGGPLAPGAAEEPGVDRFAATRPPGRRGIGARRFRWTSRAMTTNPRPTSAHQQGTRSSTTRRPRRCRWSSPARAARPGADDDAVAEWRPPRQTSRLTTILVIALLVAVGFLAGVFVGRAAAPAPTGGEQPQPAATSSARPGALR